GHLRAAEDAAAVGEVGGHDVAAPEEQLAEPDVAGRQERDRQERDGREREELDLDRAPDHQPTSPSRRANSPACDEPAPPPLPAVPPEREDPPGGWREPSRDGAEFSRAFSSAAASGTCGPAGSAP